MRGRGLCFFLPHFSVSFFIIFAVLLCRAVVSLSYIQHAYRKHKISTLYTWGMYVRHVSERMWRPTISYVASELFFPEAWRRDYWRYQVTSLLLQS